MPETVDVLYLPYLPLRERALIGDWELIPRAALVADDCLDPRTAELAQGLADVYVLPKPPGSGAGAFARPRQGRIGEAARDLPSLAALRWASVVAMLEANPSPLMPEDERNVNAGHWMLTSDNAMLVAHSIDREGGYTGTIVGSRVRRASLGVSVLHDPDNGLPRGEIPPPSGLRIPSFGPQPFDVAYADATWESLLRGDDAARRLGRAIEWLALVWLNDTGLSDDVRIPALRAGFEVLLDADNTKTLGDGLSRLLADKSAPVERSWRERPDADISTAEMTDIAWWFKQFSLLRNDLMHGRSPGQDRWLDDHGRWQTDVGEWYLRDAIKQTVANDGHPEVLEDLIWRDALRETRRAFRREDPDSSVADSPEPRPPGF